MIDKCITLKAHCGSCLELLFTKPVKITVKSVNHIEIANKILFAIFPKNINCKDCEDHKIDYSYFYRHEHKFIEEAENEELINRCKAQIAETFDYNNDIPHTERELIREGFQNQLRALLKANNIPLSD